MIEQMTTESEQVWYDYHMGRIQRELTEEEKKEIRACDFAMHLLISTNYFVEFMKEYLLSQNDDFYEFIHYLNHGHSFDVEESIAILAEEFRVDKMVMRIKLLYLEHSIEANLEKKKEKNKTKK